MLRKVPEKVSLWGRREGWFLLSLLPCSQHRCDDGVNRLESVQNEHSWVRGDLHLVWNHAQWLHVTDVGAFSLPRTLSWQETRNYWQLQCHRTSNRTAGARAEIGMITSAGGDLLKKYLNEWETSRHLFLWQLCGKAISDKRGISPDSGRHNLFTLLYLFSLPESTHRPHASPEDRASPLPGHWAFDRPVSRLNRGWESRARRSRVRGFWHRASWVPVRFPCLLSGLPGALIRSILDIRTQGGIFTTPGDAYTAPVEMWIKGLGESMLAFEIWSWIVIYFFRLPCTWHQISSSRNYWGITIYPG